MFSKAALMTAVLSQAFPALRVVHEKLHAPPIGWAEAAVPHPDTSLSFTIGLTQQKPRSIGAQITCRLHAKQC
jgi:tripeptidyl-peptidase-1